MSQLLPELTVFGGPGEVLVGIGRSAMYSDSVVSSYPVDTGSDRFRSSALNVLWLKRALFRLWIMVSYPVNGALSVIRDIYSP